MSRSPGSELPLPPEVRAALSTLAAAEPSSAPAERIAGLVDLIEGELSRLLLAPLRPWGETIGEALHDEPGGRPAAHELRLWCHGEEVKNPVSLASRALQALRKGLRAGEPRATTLASLLFRSPLREALPRPWLGLTLERFRTRFHAPLRREGPDATFDEAAARDLVQLSLGALSVTDWLAAGPAQDGLLDLLWRGVSSASAPGSLTQSPPSAETTIQPAPMPAEGPGRKLGPYELREELGRGGMGVVWSAWDPRLEREVALKVLAGVAADHESLRRFAREARAMARLEHEGIAVVYEVVEAPPRPYYVMQLVRGQTLEAWLAAEPPRPAVLEVVRRLADALAYAHARGVVHRDVKPANVMIDAAERPVLLDFGLALDLDGRTRLTATGQIMGTPRYMAPEQIEGSAEVDAAADVYSLGAVAYRALCGRPPFVARSPTALFKQVLLDPPPAPRELVPDLPADLAALLVRCLSKQAAGRPRAAEVAAALSP